MTQHYYGADAINAVEAAEGPLSPAQRRVVELEGFVDGAYEDTKGISTVGVGQTGEYANMSFKDTFNSIENQTRQMIPGYDNFPENVQAELVQATYRGDLGGSPMTRQLINQGDYALAAKEFLNNAEYNNTPHEGIRTRMEDVSNALMGLAAPKAKTVGETKQEQLAARQVDKQAEVAGRSVAKQGELSGKSLEEYDAEAAAARDQFYAEAADRADNFSTAYSTKNKVIGALDVGAQLVGKIQSSPYSLGSVLAAIGTSQEDADKYFDIQKKLDAGKDLTEEDKAFQESDAYTKLSTSERLATTAKGFQDAYSFLESGVDRSLVNNFTKEVGDLINDALDGKADFGDVASGIYKAIQDNEGAVTQSSIESIPYVLAAMGSIPLTLLGGFSGNYIEALEAYEKKHGTQAGGENLAELISFSALAAGLDLLGDRVVGGSTKVIAESASKLIGKEAAERIGGNLVTRTATSAAGEVFAEGSADLANQLAVVDFDEANLGQSGAGGVLGGLSGAQTTATLDGTAAVAKTATKGAGKVKDSVVRGTYNNAVKTGKVESLPEQGSDVFDAEQDVIARRALAKDLTVSEQAQQVEEAAKGISSVIGGIVSGGKKLTKEATAKFESAYKHFESFKAEVNKQLTPLIENLSSAKSSNANTEQAVDKVIESINVVTSEQAQAILANDNLNLTESQSTALSAHVEKQVQIDQTKADISDAKDTTPATLDKMLDTVTSIKDNAKVKSALDKIKDTFSSATETVKAKFNDPYKQTVDISDLSTDDQQDFNVGIEAVRFRIETGKTGETPAEAAEFLVNEAREANRLYAEGAKDDLGSERGHPPGAFSDEVGQRILDNFKPTKETDNDTGTTTDNGSDVGTGTASGSQESEQVAEQETATEAQAEGDQSDVKRSVSPEQQEEISNLTDRQIFDAISQTLAKRGEGNTEEFSLVIDFLVGAFTNRAKSKGSVDIDADGVFNNYFTPSPESVSFVEQSVEQGMSAKDLLARLRQSDSIKPFEVTLVDWLTDLVSDDLTIFMWDGDNTDLINNATDLNMEEVFRRGTGAVYSSNAHAVILRKGNNSASIATALHEIIHGVTTRALSTYEGFQENGELDLEGQINPVSNPGSFAFKELLNLQQEMLGFLSEMGIVPEGRLRLMEDPHEFITYALTDPLFPQILSRIKYNKQGGLESAPKADTLWDKFKSILASLLGLNPSKDEEVYSALDKLMDVTHTIALQQHIITGQESNVLFNGITDVLTQLAADKYEGIDYLGTNTTQLAAIMTHFDLLTEVDASELDEFIRTHQYDRMLDYVASLTQEATPEQANAIIKALKEFPLIISGELDSLSVQPVPLKFSTISPAEELAAQVIYELNNPLSEDALITQATDVVFQAIMEGNTSDQALELIKDSYEAEIVEAVDKVISNTFKPNTTASLLTDDEEGIPERQADESASEHILSFNWVKKFFSPKKDRVEGSKGNLLQSTSNVMSIMARGLNVVADHLERDLTNDEVEHLNNLLDFNKEVEELWDRVYVNEDPGYTTKEGKEVFARHKDLMRDLRNLDGTYPANVKAAVAIALHDWIANRAEETAIITDNDVRAAYGLAANAEIHPEMYEGMVNHGTSSSQVADSIGKSILNILNIAADSSAPGNAEQNLANSLGHFAIHLMKEGNYVTVEPHFDTDGRRQNFVLANHTVDETGMIHLVGNGLGIVELSQRGLNEQVFNVTPSKTGPSTTVPKTVPQRVKGTAQKVSKQVKQALKKHQARKHFVKQDTLNVFEAFGEEGMLDLLGNVDPKTMHVSRRVRQQQVNRANAKTWTDFMELVGDLRNNEGLDSPLYFEHEVWKQGRFGMKSNTVNPQGNKTHRALIAMEGWQEDIKFSDRKSMDRFWLAMHEPLGTKAHDPAGIQKEINENPELAGAISHLQEFLTNGEFSSDGAKQQVIDAAKGASKDSALAVDALLNLARLRNAQADPNANSFYVDTFLEVDGKTNGPIMGILQFAGAKTATELLDMLAKGGLLPANGNNNLQEYLDDGNLDAYQEIAQKWLGSLTNIDKLKQEAHVEKVRIARERNKDIPLPPGPTDQARITAVNKVFKLLSKEGKYNASALRSLAKNPLMVTVYGSSEAGVSDALSRAFISTIYEQIESAYGKSGIERNTEIIELYKNLNVILGAGNTINTKVKPLDMRLNPVQEAILTEFITENHGFTVNHAVTQEYGVFMESRATMNDGMDLMYRMHKVAKEVLIKKRIEEKKKSGLYAAGVTYLSKDDMDKIDEQLLNIAPLVHNAYSKKNKLVNQATDVSKSRTRSADRADLGERAFNIDATYANGQASNKGMVRETVSPGVGAAVLSIHSLDAANMTEMYAWDKDTMGVHDANLQGISYADVGGQKQNEVFNDVQSGISLPEEFARSLFRSSQAFQDLVNTLPEGERQAVFRKVSQIQVDDIVEKVIKNDPSKSPSSVAKGVRQNLPTSRDIMLDVRDEATRAREVKKDTLEQVGTVDQFASPNGESAVKVKGKSNTPVEATKEITQDPNMHGSTENATQDASADTYTNRVSVDGANLIQVFDSLWDQAGIASETHMTSLRDLAHDLADKVLNPFVLHQRQQGNENYGAMTPSDVFLNEAIHGTIPVTMIEMGIAMSPQEVLVHELVHMVYNEHFKNDSAAREDIKAMFLAARDQLDFTAFLNNPNIDVNDPANADIVNAAKARYNYVFANPSTNYLVEFAAFGLTNANFQKSLNTVKFSPKVVKQSGVIGKLKEMLERALISLERRFSRVPNDVHLKGLMDSMLTSTNRQRRSTNSKRFSNIIGGLNQTMYDKIADNSLLQGTNPVSRSVREALRGDRDNREITKDLMERFNDLRGQYANNKYSIFQQLMDDMLGRTHANAIVRDMARKVRQMIDQPRTKAIEAMAKNINEAFHTELDIAEREALTKVLIKLDVDAISGMGLDTIADMLENEADLEAAILNLENQLQTFPFYNFYVNAAKNLGYFMATGNSRLAITHMNAHNIARLYGDSQNIDAVTEQEAIQAEAIIDQLATLYGIKETSLNNRSAVADVIRREQAIDNVNNGVTGVLLAHKGLKDTAKHHLFSNDEESLMIKGWTKEEYHASTNIVFAPGDQERDLKLKGYKRVGKVGKDPLDTGPNIFMFVAPEGEKAPYLSQLVSLTDSHSKGTGSFEGIDQGFIQSKEQEVASLHSASPSVFRDENFMIPVFNPEGEIIDWRYMANEQMRKDILQRNDDIGDVMGAMAGNIISKNASKKSNAEVVEMMYKIYEDDIGTNKENAYVIISPDSSNERLKEIWKMMPEDMREGIRETFGRNALPVRKDLVTPIFGYRKYSVREIFQKDNAARNHFEKLYYELMSAVWGEDAARKAVKLGATIAEVVGEIKNIVIVKTGFITLGNFLSNTVFLMMNGMSPLKAVQYQREAYKGINAYQDDMNQIKKLQHELATKTMTPARERNTSEMINRIRSRIAQNPVTPTIRAGLMPTISEGVLSNPNPNNISLHDKGVDWVATELGIKDTTSGKVFKNIMQTRDSDLYRITSSLVQQSDFVARHAILKHWTESQTAKQNRRLTPDQYNYLVGEAEELFVNFDAPAPKGLQYLDDIGIGWFTKYAFRVNRTVARTVASNPLKSAATIAGVDWLDLDMMNTPFDSSIPSKLLDEHKSLFGMFMNPLDPDDVAFRGLGWANSSSFNMYGPAIIL